MENAIGYAEIGPQKIGQNTQQTIRKEQLLDQGFVGLKKHACVPVLSIDIFSYILFVL